MLTGDGIYELMEPVQQPEALYVFSFHVNPALENGAMCSMGKCFIDISGVEWLTRLAMQCDQMLSANLSVRIQQNVAVHMTVHMTERLYASHV